VNRSRPSRTPSNLSDSILQQLNMYALVASAAGVGLLALAQPAESKIVYTPANVQINGKALPVDLNHDGIVDFFLFHYGFNFSTGGNALLACLDPVIISSGTFCHSSTNALNAFKVIESMGREWGAAVKPGAEIIGGDRFQSAKRANLGQVTFLSNSHNPPRWGGPWVNRGKGVRNRYLGVKFQINGRFHFGWARLTVTTQGKQFTATLTGYAYESVAGKGIVAGKTKGPEDVEESNATQTMPTREPATLALLALGSPGLSIWRRENSAVSTRRQPW
jgi:hypothetical protein